MNEPTSPLPATSKRGALLVLQAIVSVSLIGWLLTKFDLAQSLHVVSTANGGYLVSGFACALLWIVVMALRFSTVLDKGEMSLPAGQVVAITWIGQFWNIFLPGSTGGDVYRLGTLWSTYPARKTDAVWAIFADRVVATALLAMIAGVGAFFVPFTTIKNLMVMRHLGSSVNYVSGALALLGVVALVVPAWRRRIGSLAAKVARMLTAGRIFWRPDVNLARICGWSLVGHGLNLIVFYCYARSVGLPVSFLQVCAFFPLVMLLLILPISINGHGVREVLLVTFLHSFGIVPTHGGALTESVLAISVVGISSEVLLGLPGGVIFAVSCWKQHQPLTRPLKASVKDVHQP
jgi:glycosyltransferase 2 family protein